MLISVLVLIGPSAVVDESPRALHDRGLNALRSRSSGATREILAHLIERFPESGHTHLLAGHCALMLEADAAAPP